MQQGPRLAGVRIGDDAGQGHSVALSGDGNSALVGGPVDQSNLGAAWVFTRSAGVWSQQGLRLTGTGRVGDSFQGTSVALSAFGNTAVLGGPGNNGNAGAVWVFVNPSPPAPGRLAFLQQPTDTVAGRPINPAVTLQLQADDRSPVAQSGVTVTLVLHSGTGTLSGTRARKTDVLGRARFDDLSINLPGVKELSAVAPGTSSVESASFTVTSVSYLVPIVSDVAGGSARFVTEMTLTNPTSGALPVSMLYTASLGSKEGSGTVTDSLHPGEQKQIADVLSYLRGKGLAIPSSAEQPQQGGTLFVSAAGAGVDDPRHFSVTARTASLTTAPQPQGRAGLAYAGLLTGETSTTDATLYGLRADAENRTNVAVVNMGNDSAGPVVLQLRVHDGDAGGAPRGDAVTVSLAPGQWAQPANFFRNSGVANGWVTVSRTSGTAPWIAYGVVNDGTRPAERTGDGAYVPMVK